MTLYTYTRIPRGWSTRESREATPAEVRQWKEADAAIRATFDASRGTAAHTSERFKRTPIGTTVYGGCAGTLTELYEAGCEGNGPALVCREGER